MAWVAQNRLEHLVVAQVVGSSNLLLRPFNPEAEEEQRWLAEPKIDGFESLRGYCRQDMSTSQESDLLVACKERNYVAEQNCLAVSLV